VATCNEHWQNSVTGLREARLSAEAAGETPAAGRAEAYAA